MFGMQMGQMGLVGQMTLAQRIAYMFAHGEQGAWYDPSDMSTLFQDSAGTVPVTAVEQPVGRMLDKSGRGNHATQATTTKRPVLSRRVALNLKSEYPGGVADAPTSSGLVTASSIPGFLGGTALAFGHNGVAVSYAYRHDFTPTAGVAYELSAFVKMDDGGVPQFGGDNGSAANVFEFVLSGASVVPLLNTYVVSTTEVPGIYRVRATMLAPSAAPNCGVVKYGSNSSRTFKITGFNVRLAIDAHLPYQRVNTDTDYDDDPNKFPTYIRFDGVDDAYQTNSIDFTGTDKMTVWAGVTKLSDGARMPVAEMVSYGGIGGFGLYASPLSVSNQIQSFSGGTSPTYCYSAFTPPSAFLLGMEGDISGRRTTLRKNGVQVVQNANSQGTGNYANAPVGIGAGSGGAYLNGRLYSLIVRGAATPLTQIEAVENIIKKNMRLP